MSNFLTKAITAIRHGVSSISWLGGSGGGRSRINYRREAGDMMDSSVVMAPVQWMQRALPEAQLAIELRKGAEIEIISDHPLLKLVQTPNAYYADIVLWWGTILSLLLDGNAYWLIARNGAGKPAELWFIPHWMMEPQYPQDGSVFISHYRYSPGGGSEPMRVDFADVVHFRHGINPNNIRKGVAPLAPAIREIFMDGESSNFVSALLRNMGVPGVVISPKGGAMPSPDDVQATKAYFNQEYGGDRRGSTLVMGAPTDVTPYGFNPQQMNMSEARDVAEERVCALLGVPAAVVGFGAGLQSTKVGATMEELRKLAWHNGVMPIATLIADEINRSLLSQFETKPGYTVQWNTSKVAALQEDEDKKTERLNKQLASGAITVFEYRTALGKDADDSHRIYLRPIAMIEVPESGVRPVADPVAKGRGQKARSSAQGYKRGVAYARLLQAQLKGAEQALERPLRTLFVDLGKAAGEAAGPELKAAGLPKSKKDQAADEAMIDRILRNLGITAFQSRMREIYEAQYLEVAKSVSDAAERAGLGASLPDQVGRAVIAAGGRRAGIVDLDSQTRTAMFDALAEGRAAGEGAEQLARRIVDQVEGGPWMSSETRARVIARTEAKYAQNVSTIERAKAGGVQSFIVFDGRLGPGRSVPSHIARDGSIVSAAEAEAMAEAEHPNGTLSFAPNFEEDA